VFVEHYYGPWYRCPPPHPYYRYHHGHRHHPGASWGFSFSN